jgi:phosphohistidine phosphatase SixA
MVAEGDPYLGGTASGCTGTAIPDEDFVFTTHNTVLPLKSDQESDRETGKSRSCGTPSVGDLFQSFTPSASSLTAVDLRLRAGGDFPSEPEFEMTTVLLIRHAERANDSLTVDGWIRAERLAHVALKTGVSAVYATEAVRTQQTVRRLADLRGLDPRIYTDTDTLAQEILSEHVGEVILVAGRQPTVPDIVDKLGGNPASCPIGNEFDNICIVTIYRRGQVEVINLQYGEPSP